MTAESRGLKFVATNPMLEDDSPVNAIHDALYREVLAAARASPPPRRVVLSLGERTCPETRVHLVAAAGETGVQVSKTQPKRVSGKPRFA